MCSEHVMWACTHHRETYFKRKQEERKKAKEEKRQAYVVWLPCTCKSKDIVITFPFLLHRERQRQEEARRRRQVEQEEVKVKTTGCVLHFSGCGPDTSREDLKVYSQLPLLINLRAGYV